MQHSGWWSKVALVYWFHIFQNTHCALTQAEIHPCMAPSCGSLWLVEFFTYMGTSDRPLIWAPHWGPESWWYAVAL